MKMSKFKVGQVVKVTTRPDKLKYNKKLDNATATVVSMKKCLLSPQDLAPSSSCRSCETNQVCYRFTVEDEDDLDSLDSNIALPCCYYYLTPIGVGYQMNLFGDT